MILTAVVRIGLTEASYSTEEGMGPVQICASIESGQMEGNIMIPLIFAPDTATPDDFNPAVQTLSFSEQMNTSCVDVEVNDNAEFENDETFSALLGCDGAGVQCGEISAAEVVIVNDDGELC